MQEFILIMARLNVHPFLHGLETGVFTLHDA